MNIEETARLRKLIEKAIEDHIITPEEYEMIVHVATADGHINPQEQALLSQLQQMIADGSVRFGKANK